MGKKKLRSRWMSGNERYPEAEAKAIANKYRERYGWHQGAKVYRRQQ